MPSVKDNTRLVSSIELTLNKLAPILNLFELKVGIIQDKTYKNIKQKEAIKSELQALANKLKRDFIEILEPTLRKHYLRSLNANVEGAVKARGKATQKKSFRKDRVPKTPDLEGLKRRIFTVIDSVVAVQMEYHDRKVATIEIFKESL